MRRKKIVFAGSCQAQSLAAVYGRHIAPLRDEVVSTIRLHPGVAGAELQAQLGILAEADIVVEQRYDFPNPVPDDFCRPGVKRVRYPYASAPFYWPFAVEGHVCAQPQPLLGHLPVYDDEIGDRVTR